MIPNHYSAYHHLRFQFEPRPGEVCSIQHYVMKVVSDLRQVGGFFWVLRFLLPIKLTPTTEILLKVALNNINLNQTKSLQVHGKNK